MTSPEHDEPRTVTVRALPSATVDPGGLQLIERLLDLIRVGLGRAPREDPGPVTVADVGAAAVHGVIDLVAGAAGAVGIEDDAARTLDHARRHELFTSMRLRAVTHRILDEFERAGIATLAFKGVALAAQTGREPSERPGSDLDLLIAAPDWTRAHEILGGIGFRLDSITPLPTPGSRTRYVQFAAYEAAYFGFGLTLDLHWRIGPGHGPELDTERLLRDAVTVTIGDLEAPTLRPDDALAHTWLHGAKDRWVRLRSSVDAHLLIERAGADPSRAVGILGNSRAATEGPIAVSLLLGEPVPATREAERAVARWIRGSVERPAPDEHDRPPDGYVRAIRDRVALSPDPTTAASVAAQLVVPTWGLARSRLPARWWWLSIAGRPFRIVTRLAGQTNARVRQRLGSRADNSPANSATSSPT